MFREHAQRDTFKPQPDFMSIAKILKIVFNPNEELHTIIKYIILSKYQSFWDCCNFELHILHAQFTFSFVSF